MERLFLFLLLLSVYLNEAVNIHAPTNFLSNLKGSSFFEEGRFADSDRMGNGEFNTLEVLPVPLEQLQMHGTTTLAFKYKDSIIVAVDSRASVGMYVGSRTVKKVFPISNCMVATMAGGAADCAHWIRRIARRINIMEEEYMCKLPVHAVAKYFASSLSDYKGTDLSVGSMVAGWDPITGPALFYIDNQGSCVPGNYFAVGSGASLAYAILDSSIDSTTTTTSYNENKDEQQNKYELDLVSLDEVIDIAVRAIRHAAHRDAFSGGYINILHINATGTHHIVRRDSNLVPLISATRNN